uniref:Uncharacterized protein n=1 Tax=Rhizophora mucronata TaxID=61149 RepID=A0A2P2PKS4_RHIMU
MKNLPIFLGAAASEDFFSSGGVSVLGKPEGATGAPSEPVLRRGDMRDDDSPANLRTTRRVLLRFLDLMMP